jgi:peptidoglycan/xylan/chitin deacetylase (PgdA/CDA1 family)
MKVISFYTDFYANPAARLREDLDKLGIRHAIVNVPDLGEWRRNVAFKPTFIADMLEETSEDLVYLDADTRVYDELDCPGEWDIAVRYSEYARQGKPEPLCGAMFLRNTEKVRSFMREWESAMARADISLRRPEQQELREMMPDSGLVVRALGKEYGLLAHETGEAKIVHGRWTKEAGAPPIAEEIIERRAEVKEEEQRVRGLVTLKRHNLHKRKRYQNTSHCKVSHWGKYGIPKGYRAAISLTFDDGRSTQFEYGRKILDEFGVKGTFYVCPALAQKQRWAWPRPAGNTIELASWSEILEASKVGHEIGNHSGTHPNFYKMVEDLDRKKRDADLKEEIEGSASAISRRTGKAYFTFAWPYHKTDARIVEKIELKHTGIRPLQPRGIYNMKGSVREWRRQRRVGE